MKACYRNRLSIFVFILLRENILNDSPSSKTFFPQNCWNIRFLFCPCACLYFSPAVMGAMIFNNTQRQQGQISIKLTCLASDHNPHEENDKPTLPLQTPTSSPSLISFDDKQELHGRSKAVTRAKEQGSSLGY